MSAVNGLTNVILTHSPRSCEPPCRILTKDDHFEFQLNPYTPLKLPFTIEPDDIISLNKGYYGSGKGPVWASGLSTIHFLVAPDFGGASGVRVRIFGSANAGRPTRVLLNGHLLGTMVASQESTEFVTQRTAFLPGENQLVIQVDHSAHEKGDSRILGFLFTKAQFKPVEQ